MRVYFDLFCTCGHNDETWTGNWTSDRTWHLDHSCFNVKVESDVQAGLLFRASIRLDWEIICNKCKNRWNDWIKYRSLTDGGPDYKYYKCCGQELKLRITKESF